VHEQTSPGFPSKQLSVNSDDVPRRHPLHHDLCNDWLLQGRNHEKHRQWAAMVCCPSAIASTRVTALANLQGLNVRALIARPRSAIRIRRSAAAKAPRSAHRCHQLVLPPYSQMPDLYCRYRERPPRRHTERSRTLPRHADVCLVSTEFAMTSLQVFGNGRVAA
jgi:hypothetical protein